MTTFNNEYDYYKLTDQERANLVGYTFQVKGEQEQSLYFPVKLTEEEGFVNYNHRYGALVLTPVLKSKQGNWFRLGVFSPDDMDLDLDFNQDELNLRNNVINILKQLIDKDQEYTYREILEFVQITLAAGTIY